MPKKIVTLQHNQDGTHTIIDGIFSPADGRIFLDFCTLNLGVGNQLVTHIDSITTVNELANGFKDLFFLYRKPSSIHNLEVDESLIVIIPFASKLYTNANIIAKRDDEGYILELKENNFFAIGPDVEHFFPPFVVAKGFNEMFLVQKTR